MTTGTDDNDGYWRRPAGTSGGSGPASEPSGEEPTGTGYAGPPPTVPPAPDWRPDVVSQSPQPRRLPDQDLEALDSEEQSARTLTFGIAMIAGAVLVVVTCLLCSRVLF